MIPNLFLLLLWFGIVLSVLFVLEAVAQGIVGIVLSVLFVLEAVAQGIERWRRWRHRWG